MFRITRKRLACIMSVLASSLVSVLIITTTALSGGKGPVLHRVSVGGADICEAIDEPTGCDANFSLVAIERSDGSVSGKWQDTWAYGVGGLNIAVDCLVLDGTGGAVIGGVIVHAWGTAAGAEGQRAITAVVDNGTSANDPADLISFTAPADGFCDVSIEDFPLFELAHGQVAVW